jgi:Fe2+/Zn2+ uptake regulation proteins
MKRETIQKIIVFETAKELANHPTADDVYAKVQRRHPNISRATVYRNLNSLAEDGRLLKILGNGVDRYDHNLHDHSHIECVHCKKFEDVTISEMEQINHWVEKETGYRLVKRDVVFMGKCPDCIEKERN